MIRIFYDPGVAAPIGKHIVPMSKYSLVAEELKKEQLVELVRPEPASEEDLLRTHSAEYIRAIQTGEPKTLAESQKLPWSPELYPAVRLSNGAAIATAREALSSGYSAAIVSGFHHSHRERGEGFCTFNGLIVALDALKAEKKIQKAAILDLDLHYGNGTALLAKDRPWIYALSIYGNDYDSNKAYRDVTVLKHQDGPNHQSAALPEKCDRKLMSSIMAQWVPKLLSQGRPDLLIYHAGADPYFEDPYSPLALDHADLLERDREVFRFTKAHSIPVAWVLGGGYTPDISKIVQVHVNTFRAWKEIYS